VGARVDARRRSHGSEKTESTAAAAAREGGLGLAGDEEEKA
jgi:hypothetical protein